MTDKRIGKKTKIDRDTAEAIAKEIIDFAIKGPKDLEAFGNYLLSAAHEHAKQKGGGDSAYIPKNIITVVDIIFNESDRGCALVAASYLDEELGYLLKGYFVNDKKIVEELFRPSGPIDTFFARINISYCLGLISNIARKDLDLIRKIRNVFAHGAKKVSFEDADIKSKCNELYHDVYKEKLSPRLKFVRVVSGVVSEIHATMASTKRCVRRPDLNVDEYFSNDERDMYRSIIETYGDKYLSEIARKET